MTDRQVEPQYRRFRFWVPGDPVALARARLGKHGRWYTPAKSIQAEQQIGLAWKASGGEPFPNGMPLCLKVLVICARPDKPTHSYPTRPDGDNVLKLAADALQKVGAYPNDAQVVRGIFQKQWTDIYNPTPGLEITIGEWRQEEP